jgi:hypothetical protein
MVHKKKVKTICFYLFYWLIPVMLMSAGDTVTEDMKKSQYTVLTLEQILPAEMAQKVRTTGRLQIMHGKQKTGKLEFCPNSALSSYVLDIISDEHWQDVFISESLYFLKKPVPVPAIKSVQAISATARSLGKMQGIEYYSNSRKEREILYPQAYTINDPEQRQKIPDNVSGSADNMILYGLQQDATFGASVYRLVYHQTDSGVLFSSVNLDPLYMAFIKIANPETLQLTLLLTDVEDGVLMYAMTMVKTVALPGLAEFIKKSYEARTDALFDWFSAEYTAMTEE